MSGEVTVTREHREEALELLGYPRHGHVGPDLYRAWAPHGGPRWFMAGGEKDLSLPERVSIGIAAAEARGEARALAAVVAWLDGPAPGPSLHSKKLARLIESGEHTKAVELAVSKADGRKAGG